MHGAVRWLLVFQLAGCALGASSSESGKSDSAPTTLPTTTLPTTTLPTTDGCGTIDLGYDECTECVQDHCCNEFEAFVADQNDDAAMQAFSDCSAASCADSCAWGICDSGIGVVELEVALCMGDACCDAVKDCFGDKNCANCVTTGYPPACNASGLDEQFISCAYSCGYGTL